MNIVRYPDPRLLLECEQVTDFNRDTQDLIVGMTRQMFESNGVGLAAPQIGVNLRIFVTCHTGDPKDVAIYINPELHFDGNEKVETIEGCLSIPGETYRIERFKKVNITFDDYSGNILERRQRAGEGLEAVVWQHEQDHLDGLLINRFPERKIEQQ